MLSRTRFSGFACGLALLLTAPVVAEISPETRQALRAAKTIRVDIRQEFDLMAEAAEEENPEGTADKKDKTAGKNDEGDKPAAPKPAAETPEEKYTLPLAGLASEAIKLTGWKQVGPGEPAELILTIDVHGTPLGADYIGSLSGFFYTGAELRGSVQLELDGKVVTETDVSAKIPVVTSIHSTSFFGYRGAPRDAPFRQTLPDCCEAVFTVIGRACGPGPVVAGMKLENDDQQTGASRALLEVGDASVEPALIEILGQGNGALARIAAFGLGVHGGPAALLPLFAVLRKDNSHEGQQLSETDELIETLRSGPDEIALRAERRSRARGQLDNHGEMHQAVEWALLQIESPDKFSRLTAALQERDTVLLRRGAAVVLGGMGDKRAFEPLAAAARDKEPLVRAAALAALGWLKDERAAAILLASSDDATGYVSKLARAQLAEAGEERWDKFRQSRNQPAALLEGFKHPDPLVRAAAARAVDYHPAPEIRAGLAALLRSDPQALVREAAAETLAEKGEDSSDPLLVVALADTDAATRRRAVQALATPAFDEENPDKKTERSPLSESALEPVLALIVRNEADESETKALLERIDGPGVADKLLRAFQEDHPPELLHLLAGRIADRGDKRAGPRLLALLGKATEQYAGQFAADALVALDDPAMLEPLFAQLRSGTPAARRLASNVLGRLRQARAIGPLIAAVRAGETARPGEPAEGLAGPAREALESLTGKSFATGEDWLRWWKQNSGKPIIRPVPKKPAEEIPAEEPAEEKTEDPK